MERNQGNFLMLTIFYDAYVNLLLIKADYKFIKLSQYNFLIMFSQGNKRETRLQNKIYKNGGLK